MKKFISFFFFLSVSCFYVVQAQDSVLNYDVSLSTFVSNQKELPFWMRTNQYGIVPDYRGGLMTGGVFGSVNPGNTVKLSYGFSFAAWVTEPQSKIFIDEIYAKLNWKKVYLDLGKVRPEEEYNGVSSTNGNFMLSGNARNIPGIKFRTDFISVPFTNNVLRFKAQWGEYLMNDHRYVDDTRLHFKSLHVMIAPHHRWEFILGFDHYAQWGGTSPTEGKQPTSFKDYLRIVAGREGGSGATLSDQLNALGNHLGREHFRINYLADNYTLTFYHDIPFEDASGTDFRNFPDGTYALYYGANDKNKWVSDIIYEFYYTKYQSGTRSGRGMDNYFNNSLYRSGWTYRNHTIGSPLLTAYRSGEGYGIYNNRIIGHHIGVKGVLFDKIPYKAMATWTLNYGTYSQPIDKRANQFSTGATVILPIKKLPFIIETGVYADWGDLYKDNIGMTVKLSRNGKLF